MIKPAAVFLILSLSVMATGPKFNVYDIDEAMKLSVQYNRPVVFIVASNQCSHCGSYLNGIASSQRATNIINQRYIFALSIIDKGGIIPSGIPFSGTTPTTYIFKKNRLAIQPIEGEISPDDFAGALYSFH